ncbi:hypothetical protein PG993_010534 [Apiospora rasikravindrae]|uniref:Uncharacterized protein n=1 Tax=Apiospora rasikravindrae TaxID=990691 RepID=A0ABR1SP92_9PEZI
MHILDLPNELMQSILVSSIDVRGVKRGLRLKLVCKRFNENFVSALFSSRALDHFSAPHVGGFWWMRDDRYGAGTLWHDYLVYRVMGETDPNVGRYVEIRQAAEALWARASSPSGSSSESGDGHHRPLRDIVDGLCWLALERGTKSPGDRQNWASHPQGHRMDTPTNPTVNLLCAAAYFNEVSVAAALLENGRSTPVYERNLFPQPIEIAAFRGHAEMLDLFQTHIWAVAKAAGPHNVSLPDDVDEEWIMWSVDQWPGAIQGAMLADDLAMLQRAIFPRPCAITARRPRPLLRVSGNRRPRRLQLCFAKSPAMWDYMTQLGAAPNPDGDRMEKWYAQYGHLAMLRHYRGRFAEAWWSAQMGGGRGPRASMAHALDQHRLGSPLHCACQNGYEDVTEYLLQEYVAAGGDGGRGRSKHQPPPPRSDLYLVAARAGSLRIMAMLIDCGFPPKTFGGRRLLAEAVLGENRGMVELLVRKGFVFTDNHRRFAMNKVSKLGLDSMVDYLRSWETTVLSKAQ